MAGIVRASSRREVLKLSALAGIGTLIGGGPGRAAPKKLTLMHESSFIPPYDAYVKNTLAPAYEKLTGIKVDYEVVSVGSLLTRVTTAAENASGPDLTAIGFNWAFLFDDKFVDVSDIALEIGKESGGWYESAQEAVVVNGKWKAIPFGNIGQLMNWRTDWFKEAGYDKFPDSWDELLEAGIKLKKAGHPFGFELGHGFGDNHGWLYPLLWSYGGREVEADGKTIVIDSDETARAIEFCRKFFKETMFEDCLGWTDVSNNKAFLSEQISCTNNAEIDPVVGQEGLSGNRQGDRPVGKSQGTEGSLPHAEPALPFGLRAYPGSQGGQGLPALADGAGAGGRLVRHSGHLLSAVPACLRRRADVEGRAAQPAVPRRAQDRPSAGLAGAAQPGAVGDHREVRRHRHVRQGLRRQVHQGGDRRRPGTAEADLQSGVGA